MEYRPIVGQTRLLTESSILLRGLIEQGKGINLLLRAPSGYGKTKFGMEIAKYTSGGVSFGYYSGDSGTEPPGCNTVFYDEVHKKTDIEYMYPEMDSKKRFLIFASNHDANLEEAFMNRCINMIFDPYTDEDLYTIIKQYLDPNLSRKHMDYIILTGGRNPREILQLVLRINLYHTSYGVEEIESYEGFKNVMKTIFGVDNGFDAVSLRYIMTLKKVGGLASLLTIASMMHVDQNTLKMQIEPKLLDRNVIRITSRGRSLIE